MSEYDAKLRAVSEENLRRRERGEDPPNWIERNWKGCGLVGFFLIAWIVKDWKSPRSVSTKTHTP